MTILKFHDFSRFSMTVRTLPPSNTSVEFITDGPRDPAVVRVLESPAVEARAAHSGDEAGVCAVNGAEEPSSSRTRNNSRKRPRGGGGGVAGHHDPLDLVLRPPNI